MEFPVNNKDDVRPDLGIKLWSQPFKALKDLLKNIFNLKGSLVFCTYRYPYGMKEFSRSGIIQRVCDYYTWVINTKDHGGHIEIDHRVVFLMPEDVARHFALPNFTAS